MKELAKLITFVGAVITVIKIIESRRACLYVGPVKICND